MTGFIKLISIMTIFVMSSVVFAVDKPQVPVLARGVPQTFEVAVLLVNAAISQFFLDISRPTPRRWAETVWPLHELLQTATTRTQDTLETYASSQDLKSLRPRGEGIETYAELLEHIRAEEKFDENVIKQIELFLQPPSESATSQQKATLEVAQLALRLRTVIRMFGPDHYSSGQVIKYLADQPEKSWVRDFADLALLCRRWEELFGDDAQSPRLWFENKLPNETRLSREYRRAFPPNPLTLSQCSTGLGNNKRSRFRYVARD